MYIVIFDIIKECLTEPFKSPYVMDIYAQQFNHKGIHEAIKISMVNFNGDGILRNAPQSC